MADGMKVRVRAVAGGPTHKLNVGAPCRLQDLYHRLATLTSLPASSFTISLNKRDAIQAQAEATLASLGITAGDLLFYFTSTSSVSAAAAAVEGIHVSDDPAIGFPSASASASASSRAAAVGRIEAERESSAVMTDGSLGTQGLLQKNVGSNEDSVRRELCASAALQRMSASLGFQEKSFECDVARADNGTSMNASSCVSARSQEECDIDLNESREEASMAELSDDATEIAQCYHFFIPDLLQRVLMKEAKNVSQREGFLVLALHAVMLETGFVSGEPSQETVACDPYALPSGWSRIGGLINLKYTLPNLLTSSGTAFLPTSDVGKVFLRCQTVGDSLVVYGTIAGGISSEIYRISLSSWKYLVESLRDPVEVNARLPGKRPLQEDLVISCSRNSLLEIFSNIFEFWKEVKDSLSLRLLTALCERSGLAPPPSFLLLPTELKMRVFEMLSAPALAMISCVCSELRFLTSNDDLWKEKFRQEFGLKGDKQGSEDCWKIAFVREWMWRKQRNEGLRDHRMRFRPETFPFRLRRPPYLRPGFGIRGGDYDSFPSLPRVFRGGTSPGGSGPSGRGFGFAIR
ncbi:hypothetical protein O6H91_16G056500 [Diphasiastrum complanatum]|nr:hypothetical protein O6H91_16G056500 [Diphasiastrum complanatum]